MYFGEMVPTILHRASIYAKKDHELAISHKKMIDYGNDKIIGTRIDCICCYLNDNWKSFKIQTCQLFKKQQVSSFRKFFDTVTFFANPCLILVLSSIFGVATTYSSIIEIASSKFTKPCYLLFLNGYTSNHVINTTAAANFCSQNRSAMQ